MIFLILVGGGIYGITKFASNTSTHTKVTALPTIGPASVFIPPGSARGRTAYTYASYQVAVAETGTKLCVPNGTSPAGAALTTCGLRTLQLGVYYPALSSGSNIVPYRGSDPLPLVVFAPGYDQYYSDYAPLIEALVTSGFVVVGVNFPLNDPSSPGGPDEADILNEPGDMTAVINWALQSNQTQTSPLYQLINPNKIVVAGQSDGGNVALATAYNTCCRDSRIKAAIIYSGAELPTFPGTYFPSGLSIPLLVVQGTADTINLPSASDQIFAGAPSPKYYLHLIGADHLAPYTTPGQFLSITASVSASFINGYVNGLSGEINKMAITGNVPGVATFQSG